MDLIIGSLLGDASVEKRGNSARIEFKQGFNHASYLYFIYFQFLFWDLVSSTAPIPFKIGDGKGGKHLVLRFRTRTSVKYTWFRNIFYPEGRKIVPSNIADYLTPRGLAYWIMDDGGYHKSGLILHTNSYTKKDVELLQFVLLNKFNIKTNIWLKNNNHYLIYITASSLPTVRNLVLPYMHSSMKYKVHANKKNI